ncbi:MAG: ACT domain-containing protein [Rhodospirillaceae bacterium]|nr:MAG: ACT domain-containing protein [Rhodospirillaceae bacterium]
MVGETNLAKMLASMQPRMSAETYVFCTLTDLEPLGALKPRMLFVEAEGLTLILEREAAIAESLDYDFECKMITLNVHSSLAAVGFLARVIPALADLGIGVNPVAGFYHDHLFVPADRGQDALAALEELSRQSR